MKININIDKLLFDGFRHEDIDGISASIEQELTRLFMERGRNAFFENNIKSNTVSQIDAGAFKVDAGQKYNNIGNEVAKSVFQSLIS